MRRRSSPSRRALLVLLLLAQAPRVQAREPVPKVKEPADPLAPTGSAAEGVPAPHLEQVLRPVLAHYPAILAAEQERASAEGEQLSARGGFDPSIKAKGSWVPEGYYQTRRFEALVTQPTYVWGSSVFAGYRFGQGHFATYDGKAETLDRGEVRAGINLPVIRDGYVDARRAALWSARVAPAIARASIAEKKNEIVRVVTLKYWSWVESGHAVRIARYLLRLAEDRDAGLAERVARGDLAPIEHADNQRAIVSRKAAIVQLERVAQGAAIELSFYLEGIADAPELPPDAPVPELPDPPKATERVLAEEVDDALTRRPDVARMLAQQEQLTNELALAKNQARPALDLHAAVAKDLGEGPHRLEPLEVELGVVLDVPLLARSARGKRAVVQAKRAKLGLQAALMRNRIAADINDAIVAELTARERLDLARAELAIARRLAQAERDALLLGNTTLLVVNLREQAVADAALKQVSALADYHRAAAVYQSATATQPSF